MIYFIIASGSSLTKKDVEFCKGKGKIYAVKESAFLCPDCDVLYAADTDWWDDVKRHDWYSGEKWTVSHEAAKKYKLNHIEYKPQAKWSLYPEWIATGGNSGFQAVNLAELHGARKIILLGFDMGYNNKKHWWDDEMPRFSRGSNYQEWVKKFEIAKPYMRAEVINCTRQTALKCFPKMDLKDAIEYFSSET